LERVADSNEMGLLGVLRLTVAIRPVLLANFNQIDENVLPSQAEAVVQSVRNGFARQSVI
jgi:hypothetical protein